jgi:hypothetical protein
LQSIEFLSTIPKVFVTSSPGVLDALSKAGCRDLEIRITQSLSLSREIQPNLPSELNELARSDKITFESVTTLRVFAFLRVRILISLENFPNLKTLIIKVIAVSTILLHIPKNLENLIIKILKGSTEIMLADIENMHSIKSLRIYGIMKEFFPIVNGYAYISSVPFPSLRVANLKVLLFYPKNTIRNKAIMQNLINNLLISNQLEEFRLSIISKKDIQGSPESNLPRSIEKFSSPDRLKLRFPNTIKKISLGAMADFIEVHLPEEINTLKVTIADNSIVFNRTSVRVKSLKLAFKVYDTPASLMSVLLNVFDFRYIKDLTIVDYSETFVNIANLLSSVSGFENIETVSIKWIYDSEDYEAKKAVLDKIPKFRWIVVYSKKEIEIHRKDFTLRICKESEDRV